MRERKTDKNKEGENNADQQRDPTTLAVSGGHGPNCENLVVVKRMLREKRKIQRCKSWASTYLITPRTTELGFGLPRALTAFGDRGRHQI
jgi:hypothetical protein